MKVVNNLLELDKEELIQLFSVAFTHMLERDAFLFDAEHQVQERSFMYRFATHLQRLLSFAEGFVKEDGTPLLSLDVEYNRDGEGVKRQHPSDEKGWIAPDIILHERGSGDYEGTEKNRNNIFVCEMKKDDNSIGDDANRIDDFVNERKYIFGIDFYSFSHEPYSFSLYQKDSEVEDWKYCKEKRMFVQEGGEDE